jgi:CheY-like chemotaxis protein
VLILVQRMRSSLFLLLDYDMPFMTGVEVINELQAFFLVNN